MFKKRQLARVIGTGAVVVVIGKMDYLGFIPVTTITGTKVGYCYGEDMELIGNNFKFKGAK